MKKLDGLRWKDMAQMESLDLLRMNICLFLCHLKLMLMHYFLNWKNSIPKQTL